MRSVRSFQFKVKIEYFQRKLRSRGSCVDHERFRKAIDSSGKHSKEVYKRPSPDRACSWSVTRTTGRRCKEYVSIFARRWHRINQFVYFPRATQSHLSPRRGVWTVPSQKSQLLCTLQSFPKKSQILVSLKRLRSIILYGRLRNKKLMSARRH